ncbi:response regulator [Rapidithrix thailandica]|uniref:Response regulator n=1 Tax=Rapidithrix thailandica TaxID=413964 RepID=A0AAW9RS52_9BACT
MAENTVLLAESRSIDAAYMQLLLEKNGWKTEVVTDGTEVLERIRRKQYSLILMSEELNCMDGITTVRKIREFENGTRYHIPVVGFTSYSLEGEKRKLLGAGMDFCLSKPVYKNKLLEILQTLAHVSSNVSVA